MEGRMKKYRQVSPERAKVWRERSPKYVQNRKVPVVYYLSRNRQLEHPHFIEVTVSSLEGLYLRDVIERLNVLRGRGMASMYSWSCKRSYKNGFVWHDLCEDDLILPVQGSEYVLKGSEIIEESNPGHFSAAATFRTQNVKRLPEPPSSMSQSEASSCSTLNGREMIKLRPEDEISPSQRSGSSGISPDSRVGNNSPCGGSLSLTEYKVYNGGAVDASTQTEESDWKAKPSESCTRGVSTDDGMLEGECSRQILNHAQCSQNNSSIQDTCSPILCSSSESLSGRKTETLESLIRADLGKINSSRIHEDGIVRMSPNTKPKASSMLMQLISCGSISVKDHSFGLIPSYSPGLSHPKFPSPLFSTSVMLGELDCLSENRRLLGLKLEDKEYFSGSLIETKILKDGADGCASLKRSSSYNSERTSKQLDSIDDEEVTTGQSKCIAHAVKASLIKQPRSESMRSPHADKPRISSDRFDQLRAATNDSSTGSARMIDPSSGKKASKELDSLREDPEKITKIEES
ncbi:hypothetical protein Dimus_009898 [Dionaea muscipula]